MTQWGLDTLFNPAKRHMDDEKQRLQSTREEVGDNSGGRRVDLESGKVVIRRPENEDQDQVDEQPAAAVKDTAKSAAKSSAKDSAKTAAKDSAKSKNPPSAAAQRAAARRGRTAR